MQSLAAELAISETAYLWPEGESLSLRWFTPSTEVDLCGHATLASAHALVESGRCRDGEAVTFTTRSGLLTARSRAGTIELALPADPATAVRWPGALNWAFTDPTGAVLQPRASGRSRSFFVVELADAQAVAGARVDLAAVASLPDRALILTAPGSGGVDYVVRVFGPNVGIDEDPVTGSAQCVLGPYWATRLRRSTLQASQLSVRGGRVTVTPDGEQVRIGGKAVTVLTGSVRGPIE